MGGLEDSPSGQSPSMYAIGRVHMRDGSLEWAIREPSKGKHKHTGIEAHRHTGSEALRRRGASGEGPHYVSSMGARGTCELTATRPAGPRQLNRCRDACSMHGGMKCGAEQATVFLGNTADDAGKPGASWPVSDSRL